MPVSYTHLDVYKRQVYQFIDFVRPEKKLKESFSVPEIIPEGSRDNMLFKLACSLQAKGLSDDAILAAVQVENETRCVPCLLYTSRCV